MPLKEDHVIYQRICNSKECGPHSYTGMTSLSRRLTCHLSNGAIKEHCAGKHNSSLTRQDMENKTTVLDREVTGKYRRLLFLEAIYIITKIPTISRQADNFQVLPTARRKRAQRVTS